MTGAGEAEDGTPTPFVGDAAAMVAPGFGGAELERARADVNERLKMMILGGLATPPAPQARHRDEGGDPAPHHVEGAAEYTAAPGHGARHDDPTPGDDAGNRGPVGSGSHANPGSHAGDQRHGAHDGADVTGDGAWPTDGRPDDRIAAAADTGHQACLEDDAFREDEAFREYATDGTMDQDPAGWVAGADEEPMAHHPSPPAHQRVRRGAVANLDWRSGAGRGTEGFNVFAAELMPDDEIDKRAYIDSLAAIIVEACADAGERSGRTRRQLVALAEAHLETSGGRTDIGAFSRWCLTVLIERRPDEPQDVDPIAAMRRRVGELADALRMRRRIEGSACLALLASAPSIHDDVSRVVEAISPLCTDAYSGAVSRCTFGLAEFEGYDPEHEIAPTRINVARAGPTEALLTRLTHKALGEGLSRGSLRVVDVLTTEPATDGNSRMKALDA